MRRLATVGAVIAAVAVPARADGPTVQHALRVTQQYVARWESTLIALVADERYQQEGFRVGSGMGRSAGRKQLLTSELLVVRAPADSKWLSFRDVIAVDGKPVHDRQRRFDQLFSGAAASMLSDAKVIGEEGARYNIGPFRTINTPTAPLVFLTQPYAASTDWRLETGRLNDRTVWILRYIQRKPPWAVEIHGPRTDPLTGRFWVEPGVGRIIQGELVVRARSMLARVTVKYEHVKSIDSWAPVQMQESYEAGNQVVNGTATYSNHRLFRTAGRIVRP